MMNINFYAKDITIPDTLRERIAKKLEKLSWFIASDAEAQVTLALSRGLFRAEYTIFNSGMMLRSEVVSGDLTAASDMAIEKLERQIERHRHRVAKQLPPQLAEAEVVPFAEDADDMQVEGLLVRSKRFAVKPMNVEEAIQQMELLGHTFFVYLDDQTQSICVVYRRRDGHYGLLEPEIG